MVVPSGTRRLAKIEQKPCLRVGLMFVAARFRLLHRAIPGGWKSGNFVLNLFKT